MNTKDAMPEPEFAERIAELERRFAKHDAALKFMKTILDHLKESGVSLCLTEAQSAELNRWLDEFEKDADARSSWREIWERIRKN